MKVDLRLKEVYTWFCFTRLVSNHQKCKSIRQLPDLWLMKKKRMWQTKRKRGSFGVISEVSSRTGAVSVMRSGVRGVVSCVSEGEGHLKPLQRSDPPSAWTLCHVWRPMYQPHQPCQPLITPVWQSISSLQPSESHSSSTVMPKVTKPCRLSEYLNSW